MFSDSNKIKLEIKNRRIYFGIDFQKFWNFLKIISNSYFKEEVSRKLRKYFELNEKLNASYHLWNEVKAVLEGYLRHLLRKLVLDKKKGLKPIIQDPT